MSPHTMLKWTPPSRNFRMLGLGVGQSAWSALLSVARGGGQSAVARGCINTKSRDSIRSRLNVLLNDKTLRTIY